MFQMIDEQKASSAEDRKMFWVKVGMFFVAMGALGGLIYFFAFVPYSQ